MTEIFFLKKSITFETQPKFLLTAHNNENKIKLKYSYV